jgi:hypothetical protein
MLGHAVIDSSCHQMRRRSGSSGPPAGAQLQESTDPGLTAKPYSWMAITGLSRWILQLSISWDPILGRGSRRYCSMRSR